MKAEIGRLTLRNVRPEIKLALRLRAPGQSMERTILNILEQELAPELARIQEMQKSLAR